MKQHIVRIGGFLSVVLLLAGCGFFGSKDSSCPSCPGGSSGEPLICFGTRVIATYEDLQKKLKAIQEAQPGMEAMVGSMPEKEQLMIWMRLAEGCLVEGIGREYAKEKGLTDTAEFKEMARQTREAVETQLVMQAFQNDLIKEFDATFEKTPEAELRSYYEQNRDKNPYFQRAPFVKGKEVKAGPKDFATFDEVKEQAKQVIKQAKMQEFFEAKLEELKQKYGARIEESCVRKLVVKKEEQPAAPAGMEEAAPVSPAAVTPVKAA